MNGARFSHFAHNAIVHLFVPDIARLHHSTDTPLENFTDERDSTIQDEHGMSDCTPVYFVDTQAGEEGICVSFCFRYFLGGPHVSLDGTTAGHCHEHTSYTHYVGAQKLSFFTANTQHPPQGHTR